MLLSLAIINPFSNVSRSNFTFGNSKEIIIAGTIFIFVSSFLVIMSSSFLAPRLINTFIITTGILLLVKGAFFLIQTQKQEKLNNKQSRYLSYIFPFVIPLFLSPELICAIIAASYDYTEILKINLVGVNIALAFSTALILLCSDMIGPRLRDTKAELINKLAGICMIYYGVLFVTTNISSVVNFS